MGSVEGANQMEGEWTEARRRKWKRLSMIGDRPTWNHAGVTTMFVSNLPMEIRKNSLAMTFAKFGEVVDVYIPTKKDVKKKYFAFTLDVNIAMFERKSAGAVVAKDRETTHIPPPHPQKQVAPICLSNDSPLRGWIKGKYTLIGVLHNFDHLEKAPYSIKNCDGSRCEIKYLGGLRIAVKFMNDMSREVFMKGWVEWPPVGAVVRSELQRHCCDIWLYGGSIRSGTKRDEFILRKGISEVDIDWVPFKSQRYQVEDSDFSDDGRNDEEDELDDDCDGISETMLADNNDDLEEGEIGRMDLDQVEELNRGNYRAVNDNSPVTV
ncbi:unnamed protein product [Lactuca saligna]|uniref:RRM domain-containing protein n=1 Tax=Lactuca saligna TaxID=75948 RepID=A0AA35VIQ3_LACSI|nr:unnamed protein product [Lactuca saligna]